MDIKQTPPPVDEAPPGDTESVSGNFFYPTVPTNPQTEASLMFDLPEPLVQSVPPERYSEIAFALALEGQMDEDRLEVVLQSLDLTPEQYVRMAQREGFKRAMGEAKLFVDEYGEQKGFRLRARFYAERLAPSMYRMAQDSETEPSVRLRVFESLTKLAGIDPSQDKKQEAAIASGGVTITIAPNIHGIALSPQTTVQAPQGEDIIDVETS